MALLLRLSRLKPRLGRILPLSHRTILQRPNAVRFLSTTSTTTDHASTIISIGNVSVTSPPTGSGRSDLVPDLGGFNLAGASESSNNINQKINKIRRLLDALPPSWTSHLRWMLQKDMVLQQDFLLLGPAETASDRRSLVFLYAALTGREVEYVSLSRDTSDYDLKQRKEVVAGTNHSSTSTATTASSSTVTSTYMHQAPVRAALHGRLLILDGLEKAERNVLPTLNNLLENREMSLDDGSMLVSAAVFDQQVEQQFSSHSSVQMHRVHPDFCVAALGSMYAADTNTTTTSLDPPLRSRFQARLQAPLDPGELLQAMAATSNGRLDESTLKELVYMLTTTASETETLASTLSLSSILDAVHYYLDYGSHFETPVDAVLRGHGMGFVGVSDVQHNLPFQHPTETLPSSLSFTTTPSRHTVMDLITTGLSSGRAVACVGPKGCGKSALTAELARATNRPCELFSLFKDMTARDLLLTRGTDEQGNTIWRKTPLTRAVENGTMVILDGIDKLSQDTLSSIARLLEQRQVDLPDGTRLTAHDDFACVALAHPPKAKRSWIAPEIAGMFFWVQVEPLATNELETVLSGLFPDLEASQLNAIVRLRDRLDEAVESGAADTMDEKESLVLSLRKMKHICKRVGRRGSDLAQLVRDALVTSLMPDREKQIVDSCMADCGIHGQPKDDIDGGDSTLDEELLARYRRTPSHPLLVPNPRFTENPGHASVLRDLLDAHSVGERALLIMGYQGVG
jgi:MoxR-like ATPase